MKTRFYLPTILRGWEDDPDTSDDSTDDSADNSTDSDDSTPDAEAIAARAAARATRKAKRDQAEEFGFSSVKEMTEYLAKVKEEEAERKSEEEQRTEAIAQREKELEAQAAQVRKQQLKLNIRQALADSGINAKRVDQAEVLVNSNLTEEDLEEEDLATVITDAVKALQTDTPEWFGKSLNIGSNDANDEGDPPDESDDDKALTAMRKDFERRGLTFN